MEGGGKSAGPRRLPAGPHGLPPALIQRNQRERLVAAMAEVCAERGYAGSSVAEVAKRAGVSTASFYGQFKDRRACMLASFTELFERLFEEIARACSADELEARARAGAAAAASLLAADPPTARLLSVEVLAVGPEGVRLQHEAIDRLAGLLRPPGSTAPTRPPDRAWAIAAAMVALAGRRATEGEAPTAAELEAVSSI